jgi:hypothetical protein
MTILQNPDFDEGWHTPGDAEIVLPHGWWLDYRDGAHPWCAPDGKRPEVKPNEEFTITGQYSIRAFPPAHSRGVFGIWQEVEVEQGAWYTFTAWARVESEPPGEMAAYVGIQPWAGGIFDRQMIWGKETQRLREWVFLTVSAQAFGGKIRVAMGANNKWATKNNTVWFDAATLVRWYPDAGQPPDPEPPQPGDDCQWDDAAIRAIISSELDRRVWTPVVLNG